MSTDPMSQIFPPTERGTRPMVHLLGDPYVTCGLHRIGIPEGSKRLLAYIAIHRGPIERRQVAGTLWPLGSEARAAGNLRSALWRLRARDRIT